MSIRAESTTPDNSLTGLTASDLQALAQVHGTALEAAIKNYLELRRKELKKELDFIGFSPSQKAANGMGVLFHLQDYQSKITEEEHLLQLFKKANKHWKTSKGL